MLERGLALDHVTIWRWVQRYAPVLNQRLDRERRRPNRSWRVDETYSAEQRVVQEGSSPSGARMRSVYPKARIPAHADQISNLKSRRV